MRKTKHIIAQFSIYDRTGIQRYLEKQARKGWMLEKIGAFAWKFRRIEPKNIHFAVTYFPGATVYDPYPSFRQEQFREFCAHAGWFPAASNGQMQIFYNESPSPVPIETDAMMEVQNIHKAMKKSFLPSYLVLLFCALMNIGEFVSYLAGDFVGTLSSTARLCGGICWLMLAIIEILEVVSYFCWRRKAKIMAERNSSFVETRSCVKIKFALNAVIFAAAARILFSLSTLLGLLGVGFVLLILGVVALANRFRDRMKERGVTTGENRVYTNSILVGALFIVSFLGSVFLSDAVENNWDGAHSAVEYQYGISTYLRYDDPMPLRAEELMGGSDGEYSYYMETQSTIFLRKTFAEQYNILGSDGEYRLKYTILDVKLPLIYDACLEECLDDTYREIDAEIWGADSAYQRYRQGGWQNILLCYDSRIVILAFSHDLTEEQMAIAGEILGKCE